MRKTVFLLIVLSLLVSLSACQRWKKDLAFSEKESDSPEYTTEFDKNTSPVKP